MEGIFASKNHFSYLRDKLDARHARRGLKTELANFLRIQPAFLSQVLAQKYPLSLEQADLANQFFDHSSEEAEFFLLLVSRDRAGTTSLKKHFETQIETVLKKRQLVVERLGRTKEISEEAKGVYYSSWVYAALQVACTVQHLRTRRTLSDYFSLPVELVGNTLDFLEKNGLLHKEGDQYSPTQMWLRLDRTSPHIVKHHANWRQKAIQNLEVQTDEDLHYSGVFSLDAKTAALIKDRTLEFIKSQLKDISAAPEEDLYVFAIDLFTL